MLGDGLPYRRLDMGRSIAGKKERKEGRKKKKGRKEKRKERKQRKKENIIRGR
jgi:hypothetical protein